MKYLRFILYLLGLPLALVFVLCWLRLPWRIEIERTP